MTNYQKRMKRFVWAGNLYIALGLIGLFLANAGVLAWVVFVSTGMIHYSLAVGFDAVYDSLKEHVANQLPQERASVVAGDV